MTVSLSAIQETHTYPLTMRKVISALIIALLFQFFPAATSAGAAPKTIPLKISSVSIKGAIATVFWSASKLASKEFYEIEFTKKGPADLTASVLKPLKTKSVSIALKVEPFTNYSVRVRKSLTPKVWTSIKSFTSTGNLLTGLTVVSSTYTSAELTWDVTPGATGYDVIIDAAAPVSVTTNKISLSNLTPGSKVSVAVRAKAGALFTAYSQFVTFATTNDSPIKLVAGSISTSGFTLTWEPIVGGESYNIYKDSKLEASVKTATYSVNGLLPGTSGSYKVSAVFGKNETPASESVAVTTLMDTPAALALSDIGASTVTAKWTVDKNATSYEISLYDSTGTGFIKSNTINGSLGSFVIGGLSIGTTYTVGIKTNYAKSASKQSDLASFTTTKPRITGLTTSGITTTVATLNWFPMPGVAAYEIYRDGVIVIPNPSLTPNSVSYTFTGLAPGNLYKFGIRASYLDGNKTLLFTDMVEINQVMVTDPAFAPVSTSAPVIKLPYANVPIVGATLSATNGLWTSVPGGVLYTYQWERSLDNGTTWAKLAGETKSTYKVVASDYAFKLRVRVTATNTNGSTTADSASAGPVSETYNVQIPVVRGILVSGQLLEVTDGSWSSDYPLTYRYQWKRSSDNNVTWTNISGEISPSYLLVDGDIGYNISVSVVAYSTLGSVAAEGTIRAAVAAAGNTVAPAVSGTVKVYNTLTTTSGTWLKSPTLTYQWQRSVDGVLWNNIASATNTTYVIAVDDIGFYIRSQVFGARTVSGTAYKYTSPSVATVVVPVPTAINSSAPIVSGSWTTGSTLSTTNGTWTSAGTFTYQWQRSPDNSTWSSISGATASSYVLTSADASNNIRVQVYLTGTSGADGIAYSVPTVKVGAPYNTVAPAISGTLRVGLAQSVTTGTWSGSPTYTYQWQTSSDGIAWANVGSATSSTYTPTYSVANLKLRAVITALNAVDSATAVSQVIQGFLAPTASVLPVVSGTVQSGQTLTTDNGTWPGSPNAFTYAWHRSSDGGATWTNIGGATATTYALVAGDTGYQIRSQVTVTTNAGSSTAYSLPTVAVAP